MILISLGMVDVCCYGAERKGGWGFMLLAAVFASGNLLMTIVLDWESKCSCSDLD